jgi:hypothetical protein
MSYIINKTDGTVLTEVVDGTIDQTSTDITLVGKNSSSYGEFINENFIKILESFANTSPPSNPITGQLWYDTTEGRLKAYDGNGFRVSGGTIVSNKVPSNLVQGDLWIDSYRKQLFFYDGTQLTLSGPQFTDQQGLTGLTIESILDTNQISHTVALMYVNQTLMGLWSKDQFTPATPIAGAVPGTIYRGFNSSSLTGLEFRGTISKARGLIAADGSVKTPEDFVSVTDPETVFQGQVYINNAVPLTLGPGPSTEIRTTDAQFDITPLQSGQEVILKVKNVDGIKSAVHIKATTERVGIFTPSPESTLDVNGDTIIRGNLTVQGLTTSLETNNIVVEDKTIELAKTDLPTDVNCDEGGLILKGTTDHTILWVRDSLDITNSNWTFSEHVSLGVGKKFKINNIDVLSADTLGNTVATALGLRRIGNLEDLSVDNLLLNNNTISSTDTNGNIVISPNGTGVIDADNSTVTNILDPVNPSDAVTLSYLENAILALPKAFSLDITGLSQIAGTLRTQIATILTDVFPIAYNPTGTVCRVYCTRQEISFPTLSVPVSETSGAPGIVKTTTTALGQRDTGTLVTAPSSPGGEAVIYGVVPGSEVAVLEDITTNPFNTGAATITYTRSVKVFEVVSGVWTWDSDEAASPL